MTDFYRVERHRVVYYCDQHRRWPQYTDIKRGKALLKSLAAVNQRVLDINDTLLDVDNRVEDIKRGRSIYADKPTLTATKRQGKNIATWSADEYSLPGFQRAYISLKSVQRFTEIWSLLERVHSVGLFELFDAGVSIASLGGGPGYELFATREYLFHIGFTGDISMFNLDIERSWGEYASVLGSTFFQWDASTRDLIETVGSDSIDIIIISNVMCMYLTTPEALQYLVDLVTKQGVKAILVNSRAENLDLLDSPIFKNGDVRIMQLLDQSGGRDDRQFMIYSTAMTFNAFATVSNPVFPNVPYVDHKRRF